MPSAWCFFDTLLKKLNVDEVEAVLAHELGHFKHRHITKRMLGMFALSLGGLALLGWVSQQPVVLYRPGRGPLAGLGPGVEQQHVNRGANGPHPWRVALLLFLLVVPVFSFWLAPLMAHFSRRDEFQADAYAAAQAQPAALASALLKLYEDNAATLTPDPLYARFYSHTPSSRALSAATAPRKPCMSRKNSAKSAPAASEYRRCGLARGLGRGQPWPPLRGGERRWQPPHLPPPGQKNQALVGDRVLWLPAPPGQGRRAASKKYQARRNLLYRQDEIRTKSFAADH